MLAGLAAVSILGGLAWRAWARHRVRHHPFQLLLQSYASDSMLCLGTLLAIAAASHGLGWPVYGTPAFGVVALLLFAGLLFAAGLSWRFHFARLLQRYEHRYPQVLTRTDLGRARRVKLETPRWFAAAGAFAAYGLFVWHPWNHLFHEGNVILGALAGYPIGALVGVYRYGAPAPPAEPVRAARTTGRRR